MRWTACELHAHTMHSDGDLTPEELLHRCKALGVEAVAVTDHSTESAHQEIDRNGLETILPVIRGMEWTTFFGHALIVGCSEQVDWRDATVENIDEMFRRVHSSGGIAGVAHPYVVGDPVCCGCNWEFDLHDWSLADMMEVWHGSLPQFSQYNIRALRKWTDLLDRKIYITATAARDLHGPEDDGVPYAVTYLLMDEQADPTDAAKEAIRNRRAYLSVGPTVAFEASAAGARAGIGGTLPEGPVEFSVEVGCRHRRTAWEQFRIVPRRIVLVGPDSEELAVRDLDATRLDNETIAYTIPLPHASGHVRLEVRGTMGEVPCNLAMTNPIVFE
jgi:hypothetical protein